MRKIILLTVVLFLITLTVTGFYFSKLKTPGRHTAGIISSIPADAALIFEFKNDQEFDAQFNNTEILTSFIGQKKEQQLQLLQNRFGKFLSNQSIFISLHPGKNQEQPDMLISAAMKDQDLLSAFIKAQPVAKNQLLKATSIKNKTFYTAIFSGIKEAFYFADNQGVLAGSFSKQLLLRFLDQQTATKSQLYSPLSNRQNRNCIADLYLNFRQFQALFKPMLKSGDDDFFQFFQHFLASAVLSLNQKNNALIFNGLTQKYAAEHSYFSIFQNQQPAVNVLKNIYPRNTAFAVDFAYAQPAAFLTSLKNWQSKLNQIKPAQALFDQIKKETGIAIKEVFTKQLGQEFAIVTTAANEKIAIIKVKNGAELAPYLHNLSLDFNSDQSKIKYPNLFYFLLGEPLLHFKQPYFTFMDNYLLLSNKELTLQNYILNYQQEQFLNKNLQYQAFDQLLATQSNITFFIQFKNADAILKAELIPQSYTFYHQANSIFNHYYAAAMQFTALGNNFYTNLYLQQKEKTIAKADSLAL